MKSILVFFFTSILLFAQPKALDILDEHEINSEVLNLAVTSFKQKIGYKMEVVSQESLDGVKKEERFNILYDSSSRYGLDIRIQILKDEMKNYNKKEIRDDLDDLMGLQFYLSSSKLYDENSFLIEKNENNEKIIKFTFNLDVLPREMDYYGSLVGRVYIKEDKLEKIVVVNEKSLKYANVDVDNYEKILSFRKTKVEDSYLIDYVSFNYSGTKDNKHHTLNMNGIVTEYWDEKEEIISFKGGSQKSIDAAEDYETIYVNLDRVFPLFGQDVRKLGYDLPKAFGVSLVTMFQETTFHMTDFNVNGREIGGNLFGKDSTYTSKAVATIVRADMWLFPFVNVGVILGQANSTTDVLLHIDTAINLPPILGGGQIPIQGKKALPPIKTSSFIYGLGATFAGGEGNFFGTVDMQYITAYTEAADVEMSMTIITPIVGYSFPKYGVRVLAGAQYQDIREEITASVDLTQDGNQETIVVGLKSEKWAGLIGVEKGFTRNWNGSLMYTYGEDRQNFNIMVGYRF
jgi:hypothetical protein